MSKNLILGSYGRGNIGDDLFLIVLLDILGTNDSTFNAAYFDLLPDVAKKCPPPISTLHSKDLLYRIKVFITTKNIFYGGGDLWVALYGDRYPNKSLLSMLLVNIVAKILFKKIHYIGCGAGNLSGKSLIYAKLSARLADTIIVRDATTLKTLGVSGYVLPDLTITLDIDRIQKKKNASPKKRIGVSVMHDVPDSIHNFRTILDNIATYIKSLDPNKTEIILIPMLISKNMEKDDLWASKQLKKKLTNYDVSILTDRKIDSLLTNIKNCNLIISVRLHTNILATWLGTPTLGIAYRPKVSRFLNQYSLSDRVVKLDQLDLLSSRARKIINDKIGDETVSKKVDKARILGDQYRKIIDEAVS